MPLVGQHRLCSPGFYLALKYWLLADAANNRLLAGMAKGLQHSASLFPSLFLIPAAASFFGA